MDVSRRPVIGPAAASDGGGGYARILVPADASGSSYSTTVETESWEEFKDGSVKIEQTIYVQRDSQKAIILGKTGTRVREIGAAARQDLTDMFGRKVHLFIYVKVRDKWMDDRSRYSAWGLNFNA